jgi:hypothetical protein
MSEDILTRLEWGAVWNLENVAQPNHTGFPACFHHQTASDYIEAAAEIRRLRKALDERSGVA